MLKINGKEQKNPVTVGQLKDGDCFKLEDNFYRVTKDKAAARGVRCYNFQENRTEQISKTSVIEPMTLDVRTDSPTTE